MKDLSIAQEYVICTVNGTGTIPGYNQKAVACLVLSGLLELQLAECVAITDKMVRVCAELPEDMAYLKPLYHVLDPDKPMKVEAVVQTYTIAFTNKKLYELLDALMESLKAADAVQPVPAGLFGKKGGYTPKKEIVTGIIEKIRAELLEDGEVSEDVIALTALMERAGNLKDYFSKYEQNELKNRLEAIKTSEAGTLAKEMTAHIDALAMAAMLPALSHTI